MQSGTTIDGTGTEYEGGLPLPQRARVRRGGSGGAATCTEFEHCLDGAAQKHLPRPAPGGFSRGSFIGWRRTDRRGQDWSIGDVYEFMGKLGEGGFGVVHSARHRRTGEEVAIKALSKDVQHEQDAGAIRLEAEFLKVADHPNLIRYYESLDDERSLYLVMEMCSGGSLSQHIKAAHDEHGFGISENDLARVMAQMLRSVAYCHAHAIVHRDLKPQNFLFGCGAPSRDSFIPVACSGDADAPLKLVDFGVSGVVRTDRPEKRKLTRRAGTDGYMAPEVLRSLPYGPAADIFSLGAVMHTMISGKPPRWSHEQQAYAFPGSIRWRSLSPFGQEFLAKLLRSDPVSRPTAIECLQDRWFTEMDMPLAEENTQLYKQCITRMRQFSLCSKLQRSILYSMVAFAPLHNHHMERLRMAFLSANPGVAGGITREEFFSITRCAHDASAWCLSAEDLFSVVNSSGSSQISYSEWLAAAAPQDWYNQREYLSRAFETLDPNRNGYVTASDLCDVLPGVFRLDEIADEMQRFSPSGNGRLTFEDFCTLSRSTPMPRFEGVQL